jgi:hypothetical protein
MINMREFVSQNTGKKHTVMYEYWLKSCPVCKTDLFWNSYSDKEVSNKNMSKCISFDIKIQYCEKCDDYYVCIE